MRASNRPALFLFLGKGKMKEKLLKLLGYVLDDALKLTEKPLNESMKKKRFVYIEELPINTEEKAVFKEYYNLFFENKNAHGEVIEEFYKRVLSGEERVLTEPLSHARWSEETKPLFDILKKGGVDYETGLVYDLCVFPLAVSLDLCYDDRLSPNPRRTMVGNIFETAQKRLKGVAV